MKRLNIDLGERSYDILIGRNILPQVGEFISKRFEPSRSIIITHPSVRNLFGEKIESGLVNAGYSSGVIEIPEGEISKSLQQAELVYDRMLEMNCDRKSTLIALGGGVVGDLTGFIAATYQRGIPFIQIPTTLLSQVDSSVGGKTAVNHPRGKNMIGAFYQPKLVVIDLDTRHSLPKKEFRAGLAEVVKYGIIADASLFSFIEENISKILSLESGCLEHIIETSCAIKARVVSEDEKETLGIRILLNYGHTVGHAIESTTGYSKYLHGEAVSIGMMAAALLSNSMGMMSDEEVRRQEIVLNQYDLPTTSDAIESEKIIEAIKSDKKTVGGSVN